MLAVWVIGIVNAFNLMDNLDGATAMIGAVSAAGAGVLAQSQGGPVLAELAFALAGACAGFLVFNLARPARIFLGDGGSLVFGFVLATTAITGWQKGATALAAAVPLLIFALPLADAATTLTRRVLRRPTHGRVTLAGVLRQIAEPDREHIHHRLLALGWSTRRIVLLLYAATILFSAMALATASYDR